MAPRNRVVMHVEEGFEAWGKDAVRNIHRKLDEVMPVAVEAAKAVEKPRNTGALNDGIHQLPAEMQGSKIVAGVGASDWKSNFYEQGTGASRSKRIKHARTDSRAAAREQKRREAKAAGSTAGVKALHFLRKGLTASRAPIFEAVSLAIREARAGLRASI